MCAIYMELKGNFSIVDGKEYGGIAEHDKRQPIAQFIHCTMLPFVKQQQYFFDMLWCKAIPAKQRFREIEYGDKREFVEIIRDPKKIQQLRDDLIASSNDEI